MNETDIVIRLDAGRRIVALRNICSLYRRRVNLLRNQTHDLTTLPII